MNDGSGSSDDEWHPSLDHILAVLVGLASTSFQIRTDSENITESLPHYNADSALLLALPRLIQSLANQDYDVSESLLLAQRACMHAVLTVQRGINNFADDDDFEPAITTDDIETAYAALESIGIVSDLEDE
jgi:hypothetical protein